MEDREIRELRLAVDYLEHPGMAARLTNMFGVPIEKGFDLLPERWADMIHDATRKSLEKSLEFVVVTMGRRVPPAPRNRLHKLAVTASGGIGGAFGIPALAVELPLSTIIMLRSIADIARGEGENLREMETRLQCLQVFALGGRSQDDDASEAGYYAVRAALAKTVSEAASYLTERGMTSEGAPALVRLISSIASRFGMVVSEKVAAMAVPVVGAAGGAMVNALFMDHFQKTARGHFIVRRLERKYGTAPVEAVYRQLKKGNPDDA